MELSVSDTELSETEFGGCRGWSGRRGGTFLNPARDRCTDVARVFESPDHRCYMAETEGRRYWAVMREPGSSFLPRRFTAEGPCPFRDGLYQLMRNRIVLDAWRDSCGLDWCDFVVCVHPANQEVFRLPEPVAGSAHATEAFRAITTPDSLGVWDPRRLLTAISSAVPGTASWLAWMQAKSPAWERSITL